MDVVIKRCVDNRDSRDVGIVCKNYFVNIAGMLTNRL